MAIIGKIRNRMGGLLVILVGGALALFVMSDLFDNYGRGGSDNRAVGTIGGEEVSLQDFERRVSDEVESLRNDFGQNVDAASTDQIRNSVWNEIVKRRVLKTQAEEAGFGSTLSKEEFDDIRFGNNIVADFKNQPAFQDPATGQVDPEKVRRWFENVQTNSQIYYDIQKERMVENRLYTKYNTLVKKSLYVNSAQARDEFEQKNLKAAFSFVAKPFASEPDSLYPVSDADLRRYYDAHKGERRYEQKASRTFDFVSFTVTATEEDKEAIRQELEEMKESFATAPDDSLFVVGNSESRTYALVPYAEGTADHLTDSLITHADTGAVIGPYQDGNVLKLVKVKELADVPEARVRHILLKTGTIDDDQVKSRADSILAVVKRDKSKFEGMVNKFSDDPASKSTGGVYEWFDKKRMVPEFTAASFDEKVGAITLCKTTYGYHIVEVLGQRTRKERRICTADRAIKASPATFNAAYKKANEFSLDNTTEAAFKAMADSLGLTITPVEDLRLDQRYVPGLQDPNAVIGWVNNAEVGQVSKPLQSGDVYVVGILKKIKEEGAPELEDVRDMFTKEVVKEKKAEAYAQQMAGKTDLSALATELGLSVQTASDLTFNTYSIPGGYSESEVIGRIFALKDGEVSAPLSGDNGVFVVQMTTLPPAPEITDLSMEKKALADRLQGRAEGAMYNALREAAHVTDERGRYY